MIPKVIHYCWFGGNELPPLAVKCIESWKKYLPEYEIKRWDETNFDVHMIPYISEAYEAKKYAFVSDYARFWVLHKYGGLYFDTDVEVIKPLDDIISAGPFMGCENYCDPHAEPSEIGVAPGLGLGAIPNQSLYKNILELYSSMSFRNPDGSLRLTTVVSHITGLLCDYGLKNTNEIQEVCGIKIYPKEYFCPQDYVSGKIEITENTRTIHHYAASWQDTRQKMAKYVERLLGKRILKLLVATKKRMLK